MLTAFSLAAPSPTTAASSPTTVTWGKEPMRLSSTGPESTLPTFMFMSGAEEGGDIFAGFNFSGGTGKVPTLDYHFNMAQPGQPNKRKALKTVVVNTPW